MVSCVALLILAILIYLLTGSTLLHEQAHLYLYIPDATGISADSPVAVNGITVGTVASVQLSGSNAPNRTVKVVLDITRDRLDSISSDSYAQVASDSLVGDKLIQISSGSSGTPLKPGMEIPFQAQTDLMKNLDLTQFENELRSVDVMLTQIEQGKSAVGQFVLGEQMYEELKRRVGDIEQALHSAAQTSGAVGEALYTNKLYDQIRAPIVQVDQTLAQMQSGQGAAGQFLRDPAQYESFRKDIADLRKSIADLRGSDFLTHDQMYTDWNRTLANLIQQVDEMNANPMFNTTEMYDSVTGSVREMRDTMKDFRENPRKFLRLKVF